MSHAREFPIFRKGAIDFGMADPNANGKSGVIKSAGATFHSHKKGKDLNYYAELLEFCYNQTFDSVY